MSTPKLDLMICLGTTLVGETQWEQLEELGYSRREVETDLIQLLERLHRQATFRHRISAMDTGSIMALGKIARALDKPTPGRYEQACHEAFPDLMGQDDYSTEDVAFVLNFLQSPR